MCCVNILGQTVKVCQQNVKKNYKENLLLMKLEFPKHAHKNMQECKRKCVVLNQMQASDHHILAFEKTTLTSNSMYQVYTVV